DLGEDAAGHPKRRGAQRFADGEPDEAGSREVPRKEQQDAEHDQQLDADQDHPDAHARAQRNRVARIRLPAQAGEGGPRVRERVDPDPVPGHAIAARDADDTEQKNDDYLDDFQLLKIAEVENDDNADEYLEDEKKLALGQQIGFAGLPDQLRHFQ